MKGKRKIGSEIVLVWVGRELQRDF